MQALTEPSILSNRTEKIFKYVKAYNEMNVESMITDFADEILFLNVMNGEKTMELQGIEEFKRQAVEALSYFSERQQSIASLTHNSSCTKITINYKAVAAMDFSSRLKKGDEINIQGKSIFEFSTNGKIVRLTDIG